MSLDGCIAGYVSVRTLFLKQVLRKQGRQKGPGTVLFTAWRVVLVADALNWTWVSGAAAQKTDCHRGNGLSSYHGAAALFST